VRGAARMRPSASQWPNPAIEQYHGVSDLWRAQRIKTAIGIRKRRTAGKGCGERLSWGGVDEPPISSRGGGLWGRPSWALQNPWTLALAVNRSETRRPPTKALWPYELRTRGRAAVALVWGVEEGETKEDQLLATPELRFTDGRGSSPPASVCALSAPPVLGFG